MSKWLSTEETEKIIKNLDNSQKLFQLYGLSLFTLSAFYAKDFEPDTRWIECIVLTDHAKQYLNSLHQAGIKNHEEYEHFALFQLFYHHDLFIDYTRTDIDRVISLLSELHQTRRAIWPYIFGNQLYHKFNDTNNSNRTSHLDADQAESLLSATPQGIFQVGNIISGPLGFQKSS